MNSAVRDANRHLSWRLRGQGADLITGRVVTAGQQPAWATVVMAAFAPVRQGGHRSGCVCRSHGYSHRLPVRRRLRRGVILGE